MTIKEVELVVINFPAKKPLGYGSTEEFYQRLKEK